MTSLYNILTAIIVAAVCLTSCASREMVSEKSVDYLNKKYNEKFRVVSVDMNHNEGNWGSADLIVSPENDSSLTFNVIYNYSDEKLTWENYKSAIWNREIGKEAEKLIMIGKGTVKVKARITAKGSIAFSSMDLPYKKDYTEILPIIDRPAVSFDVDFFSKEKCTESMLPYEILISAAENFRGKGFRKVMMSVNLFCGDNDDRAYQTLKFKLLRNQQVPAVNTIKKLTLEKGESPLNSKASSIYAEARRLHESGNTGGALQYYMEVLRINDNPYRYNPYAPVESGFVIESAYYAAGIENAKGNKSRAEKLYKFVADRIAFFEVKGEFFEMEKKALEYLKKK